MLRFGSVIVFLSVTTFGYSQGYTVGKTTPPFQQCPPVGADSGCAVLIYYDASGNVNLATDSTQPPYEHIDDALIGVQNNSTNRIFSLRLTNPGIFGFDGDGVCGRDPVTQSPISPRPSGCPFSTLLGATGYEGPGISFTVYDSDHGTINFVCPQFCLADGKTPAGLLPGQSAWFTLEGTPDVVQISSVCGSSPDVLTPFSVTFPPSDVCSIATKGPRMPTWASYGTSQFLVATSGEKLELRCDSYPSGSAGAAYLLFYTPAPPAPVTALPVGIDPWPNGYDTINIQAVAASTTQLKCIGNTQFSSWDYGPAKTFPNALQPLTGGTDQFSIDRFISMYDTTTGGLSKVLELYPPPTGSVSSFYPHDGKKGLDPPSFSQGINETKIIVDPPLGPITNTFFQNVVTALVTEPQGMQQGSVFSSADFNHDGKVDTADFTIFQKSFGSCIGQTNYNGATDLDTDGCVTFKDYQIWFKLFNVH